jgi:hypothetical protein
MFAMVRAEAGLFRQFLRRQAGLDTPGAHHRTEHRPILHD